MKFVDLRFTDTKGKMQHVTADVSCVDEAMFEGYAFDGSSIAGWKGIESSDMFLKPDPASAHVDPFFAQTTLAIFCDVIEPLDRPALRARSALHRQEGRGLHDVARHRRQGVLRPRGRVLHLRRREVLDRSLQHRLQRRQLGAALQLRHRVRDGQPRPPPAHQGRLLPGSPDRQLPGHPLRDALRPVGDGRRRREAPSRGGLRPARTRHQVRPHDHHGRPHADL